MNSMRAGVSLKTILQQKNKPPCSDYVTRHAASVAGDQGKDPREFEQDHEKYMEALRDFVKVKLFS